MYKLWWFWFMQWKKEHIFCYSQCHLYCTELHFLWLNFGYMHLPIRLAKIIMCRNTAIVSQFAWMKFWVFGFFLNVALLSEKRSEKLLCQMSASFNQTLNLLRCIKDLSFWLERLICLATFNLSSLIMCWKYRWLRIMFNTSPKYIRLAWFITVFN